MIKMPPRAAKILVVLACSLGMASVALGQSYSVNYRGQQQEDLTCMQASVEIGGQTVVYRNDPSTNCFGFPSIQFDDVPVVGGKPNSLTIDWSLMVDELQMQDDDRLHIHLPGFTGGHNTFGIMGPAIDTAVKGALYTPNFKSEFVKDDVATTGERADFGALVGIWGISCGTEENLYMDRAKVDNLRTAEWDPATEMLKVVLKAQRFGPVGSRFGRHDGYTGVDNHIQGWTATDSDKKQNGLYIPFSQTTTVTGEARVATKLSCQQNRGCPRGNHLQAMEYSRQGPTYATAPVLGTNDNSALGQALENAAITASTTVTYGNDGFILAPGFRVCGIYVDSTKLYREQLASKISNGLGPLPPYGGIGKNWFKAAFIRRFRSDLCAGGFSTAGKVTRPGMNPETCSPVRSKETSSLDRFWQVPFDGDTERVVGFQFTTTDQMLPVNKGDSAAGTLVAPSFSYARAKGKTTGINKDNCITVTLMPSVTFVSGTAATQITIEGLTGSGSSDNDQFPLFMDSSCKQRFNTLVGSNGAPIKNFRPVDGTGISASDPLKQNYRPFGQANRLATGNMWKDSAVTLTGGATVAQYYDDVDWHTRANRGTMTALTTGDPMKDMKSSGVFGGLTGEQGAGTLAGVKGVVASTGLGSKLSSPVGDLSTADGNGKFEKAAGKLTVNLSPGYFLQKGEILVFSFVLQNSAETSASKDLTVSATGAFCDSDNGFCDGNAEKTLNIQGKAIANGGKLLEVKANSFVTSKIFQASSDPNSLTTIFVTLTTNVDLKRPDSSSDSKITISGLCGFETGTDVLLYQNQKSGGLPFDNKYPIEAVRSKNDLPGLGADDSKHVSHTAKYDGALGQLKIDLGTTGFVAETDYAFAFQLQTKKTENAACVPKISSSGGSVAVAEQDFAKATNVGKVDAPRFTTLKIGQVTTRPDVPNFLCVTLQHNFEFYTDSAVTAGNTQQTAGYVESKITISGLTGTQAVSTPNSGQGYALAYCPTELPYFDDRSTQHTSTQFQPELSTNFAYKRYKTYSQADCLVPAAGGQNCIPGNPFSPDTALDGTMAGRSWFGGQVVGRDSFVWTQETGTAVLTVDPDITASKMTEPASPKGGIPKNAEIVFALPLQNSKTASDCKTVKFESSGRIVQQATMVTTKTGRALQDGEQDGDACPLKVYAPGFLVKKITQSTSVTGAENIMTVSLRSNVDFASIPSGQASWITISGLTGTATGNADLGVKAPNFRFSPKFEKDQGVWTQGDGKLILKIDPGVCRPPTVWAAGTFGSPAVQAPFAMGGSDSSALTVQKGTTVTGPTSITSAPLLGTSRPSTCVKAGFLYVFSFTILNPDTEQSAPTTRIEGRFRDANNNEVVVPPVATDSPISDDLDKVPMRISDQTLTTYKIGQLVPAPGATNVICVTLQTSKDIESKSSELLSTITISGLDGFNADPQDLQLFKNDGVTKITPESGDPKDDPYSCGGVFKARNTADTTTNIGFVRYTGTTDGKITMEIVGRTTDATATHVKHMQKNVDHKFCFRLKNPDTPMKCKDVLITVANQGKISTVKAKLDVTTTIEDYPARSACPGYVAAPGFVIKNWRSSSNITGDVAIIHMQLASNYELEAGDKVSVTGLTSYTRSCQTPPCDVGITVTRAAVTRKFGKPYMNGVRNVRGCTTGLDNSVTCASDAGALAANRQSFAMAIQSYDLSGAKDDGTRTSTFGDNAEWGKSGDTEDTVSTLTFTVAKTAVVAPADIKQSSDATLYEVVFKLTNKASATSDSNIKVAIREGQKDYDAQEMNTGKVKAATGISNVGGGGMDITYTTMKTIYGGESLILTLPKFSRDSNGMLFGITSAPSEAFITYSTWADWKAYGTDEAYARAFFTNGWVADGVSAKSGDSGQTGERWNFPNVNAKVTTDADYNHDTGVLVLDSADPGVGLNKDYWYAATENNLYEGRVTPVARQGAVVGGVIANPPAAAGQKPGEVSLPEATADYYLDNGEALDPIMGASALVEDLGTTLVNGVQTQIAVNGYARPHAMVLGTDAQKRAASLADAGVGEIATGVNQRYNNLPAPMPAAPYKPVNDYDGTPPFKGIPLKFAPSRRDNFYKGMLMKCWIGESKKTDYSEDAANDKTANVVHATQYRPFATGQPELLPPPFRTPASAFGDQLVKDDADPDAVPPAPRTAPYLTAEDINNGQAFAKAGVSRVLETRVIQASFRQIDYIPRKKGGCHFTSEVTAVSTLVGGVTATLPVATAAASPVATAAASRGQVGCQDEVPGFPAIVRLESPFSRALDPDTLCYIQRKSHVGVYTGMTAMVGQKEYTLKQGAANLYTVSHVADDMKDANGNAVDRMVPRSYSTEDAGLSTAGLRGEGNTLGFFSDGVGLSGQPYTIYSQLELVAQRGATVSVGETVTITIPTSAQIFPPADMNAPLTPSVDSKPLTLADATRISHVLLVPLSPACSIVGAYGVPSGCQSGNGKGGAFDLMLSTVWPYAYDSENGNDITGYPMTVFGGQSTVIKTMADKHSQDLPIRPLEGAIGDTVAGGADLTGVLNPTTGTHTMILNSAAPLTGGRVQSSTATGQATGTVADIYGIGSVNQLVPTATSVVTKDPNAVIVGDFTVVKELDAIALTSGTARTSATKAPRLPNAPITLVNGGCGAVSDGLAATLPYAVCLSLGGGVAHNQELVAGAAASGVVGTLGDEVGFSATTAANIASRVAVGVTSKTLFRPKMDSAGTVVVGPQDITGAVGQQVTPVVADKHSPSKTYGSAAATPDYGTFPTVARVAPDPKLSFFEEAGDNLGLGAFLIVGVYKQGTSDRFVWSTQGNKGTLLSALPVQNSLGVPTDVNANLVVQRWLGTSREAIPLANIPSGLIGGDVASQPSTGYPAPAGSVPRYQARIGGGYSIGRFAYGISNIMRVRSDVTSMAQPTGIAWATTSNTVPAVLAQLPMATTKDAPLNSFMAVPHHIPDRAGAHLTGHSLDLTPTVQEALVFGRSTLPLPQVIHTAQHTASATASTNMLSRGHCGVVGASVVAPSTAQLATVALSPLVSATVAAGESLAGALTEGCLASSFNTGLPFSRNVYIEKGMDVYIVSSIFDTLIQRPEPPRKHLGRTINNRDQMIREDARQLSSGWFATGVKTGAALVTGVNTSDALNFPASTEFFPGSAKLGVGEVSNSAPFTLPLPITTVASGDFTADNERIGLIQTLGTPKPKGMSSANVAAATGIPWTVKPAAAAAPNTAYVENQYGFDQDFRLYSVLGPFMRPSRIKDMYDGSKIAGAAQSKFPGVLTMVMNGTSNREINIYDTSDSVPFVPIVQELIAVPVPNSLGAVESFTLSSALHNNALWSMAPVAGTSYAKTADRNSQYHKYVEAGRILTFCNPLQGDLNNAPGSAIMTDISDSPVNAYGEAAPGTASSLLQNKYPHSPTQSTAQGTTSLQFASQSPLGNVNTQQIGNGKASASPGVWTVPRRHSLCRKMVTGNPLLTSTDMRAAKDLGGAAIAGALAANEDYTAARARFTESVQFNNVLNQDPSPNMRGMVTYVEPTKITVTKGTVVVDGVCKVSKISKEKQAGCTTYKIELKSGSSVEAKDKPDWFSLDATETAYADAADFDATTYPAMLKDKDGKDIAQADRKYGLNWYDKRLCLGAFLKTVVSSPPAGASPHKFLIKHKAVREVAKEVLESIDTKLNGNRRRSLLATACPSGFDARLIVIGTPLSTACECPKSCGQDLAECTTDKNGTNTWNQVQLLERVCREEAKKSDYDPTGAIVGGVLGGFFGLLLLLLLAYFCCFRKKEVPPTARPVPMQEPAKPLAPVYLPQPYPALPEQFAPAPMPAYPGMEGVVQPTGQPMLYSSMQGVPYLQPGMETYPPQPGGYPAPYGVVPQPAYGI